MELVYLWVEDYTNIQKQGFDFSPRFTCDYDGKELTIQENDDYIENFFGENINVTAIVGKNGSGKSSVLECLSDSPKFIVTFENNQFFINQNIKLINKTKYSFTYKIIELEFQHIVTSDYIVNNASKLDDLDGKTKYPKDFIAPKNNLAYMFEDAGTDNFLFYSYERTYLRQLDTFFNTKNLLEENIYLKNIYLEMNRFGETFFKCPFQKLLTKEVIEKFNLSDLVYTLAYENIYHLCDRNDEEDANKWGNFITNHFFKNHIDLSPKKIFLDLENELLSTSFLKKYKEVKYYCQLFDDYTDIYSKNNQFTIPYKRFNGKIAKYGHWEYGSFNNISLDKTLSSGEIGLLNLFSYIFYSFEEKEAIKYLYIDEGETFLHPNWQKKYLSYIIQFIKDNFPNRKIHIILTSHSPFLLSDIPKQNIIFLDKDENGNCKVVDGLKEKKQTFGANIHTLLSDSFFMEDGLMGEFAKGKIDKAIKLLNQDKLDEKDLKYCEQIISIIGEPIVKNQLQRMLTAKKIDYLAKDTREEIEFLKHRIDLLSKRL